jgi:PAS domain S-box-containing protein
VNGYAFAFFYRFHGGDQVRQLVRAVVPAFRRGGLQLGAEAQIAGAISNTLLFVEHKRSEEALRVSEERYRSILESIEDGYYEVDIAGNFTFFNDSMCQILGYSKEEMMGMNNRQYTDQKNAKKLYQAFNKVFRTEQSAKGYEWEIIKKDGTKRDILYSPCQGKN